MRALIQVVKSANVTINNNCVGKINKWALCISWYRAKRYKRNMHKVYK